MIKNLSEKPIAELQMEQADQWEKAGRYNEAFNVRRYLSQQDGWIHWIDSIVAILQP